MMVYAKRRKWGMVLGGLVYELPAVAGCLYAGAMGSVLHVHCRTQTPRRGHPSQADCMGRMPSQIASPKAARGPESSHKGRTSALSPLSHPTNCPTTSQHRSQLPLVPLPCCTAFSRRHHAAAVPSAGSGRK